MRVLVLVDAFRMGGAETLLAPLARAAHGSAVQLDFVAVSPRRLDAEKTLTILAAAGIRTRNLNIRRLLDPTALPRVLREIRRGGYAAVHAHLEMAMTLAVPAARIAGIPVFCTFHHVARPLRGRAAWRERLAVAAASASDGALFVSEASRASFVARYRRRGTPPNWQVLHNGIDVDLYRPGPADPRVRAALGAGAGPLVVLPAAFRDFKGIPVAIEAWRSVHRNHPDATLALVGGGPAEPHLRAAVAAFGLTSSVRFAGVRTDMPEVYRAADAVLLPSTHGENLPTVLIEASASGRAIAASRIGGIPDIVADGVTGLLFEPGDPVALAAVVERLIADAGLRDGLGGEAVRRAHANFSARSWLSRLHALYAEGAGHG